MTDQFYNPYYFAPVPQTPNTASELWQANQPITAGNLSHAKYEGLSGRILCAITTQSPVCIGEHKGKEAGGGTMADSSEVKHFRIGNELAIPATSIRGMLTSVFETATGSALRVLDDKHMSTRAAPKDALSAIGVIWENSAGEPSLIPLTYPTLQNNELPSAFKPYAAQLRFKLYTKETLDNATLKDLNAPNVCLDKLDAVANTPEALNDKGLARIPSRSEDKGQKFPIIGRKVSTQQKDLKKGDLKKRDSNTPAEKRALLRAMGSTTGLRKHEIVIPVLDDFGSNTYKHAILPKEVITTFETLATEANKANGQDNKLPYRPFGMEGGDKRNKIKKDDLVYFNLKRVNDDISEVTEISFSAIWRKNVPDTVHQFFDPEMRPFHPERNFISPAESLFGFIASGKTETGRDKNSNYSSRIRILDARLAKNSQKLSPQILSLPKLGSPKLPCGCMYFRSKTGTNKVTNPNPQAHSANGRKYYIHHPKPKSGSNIKENNIECIPMGTTLHFEIRFNNLSQAELNALCYAIKPQAQSRHKIGMGKPHGLGQVDIQPIALQLIDREKRYRRALDEPRYHKQWLSADFNANALAPIFNWQAAAATDNALCPQTFAQAFRNSAAADKAACTALETLLNPDSSKTHPIHYPLGKNQKGKIEIFNWFVNNNRNGTQTLPAVTAEGLSPLERNES